MAKNSLTTSYILQQRAASQQLTGTKFKTPQAIVRWFGAMQAQEYAMAKWAIALRLSGSTDKEIENSFNKGEILRTHVLRPTWHFVVAEDIRWMLQLTSPRVHAANASLYRKTGLDKNIFKRSNNIFEKALAGNNYLTRDELNKELVKKKITASGQTLAYIFMQAELDGIICSGPRKGKQFTYALIEERAPTAKLLTRSESLTELTHRYFTSRGPAMLQDYVWWSGLTVKDSREGISNLSKEFIHEVFEGREYIFKPQAIKNKTLPSFLMPDYDEYGISYKDRSVIFNNKKYEAAKRSSNPIFNRMIIIDGIIEGTWQRIIKNNKISVETYPFITLNKRHQQLLGKAVKQFNLFLGESKKLTPFL